MFYNDFILLFIEKYPQKYPLFFLLPPKKPSFKAITTRLRRDYGNCQQIEFTVCLDNRVLSVGKNGFIRAATLFYRGAESVLSRLVTTQH